MNEPRSELCRHAFHTTLQEDWKCRATRGRNRLQHGPGHQSHAVQQPRPFPVEISRESKVSAGCPSVNSSNLMSIFQIPVRANSMGAEARITRNHFISKWSLKPISLSAAFASSILCAGTPSFGVNSTETVSFTVASDTNFDKNFM